jgi:hypothetical protein
MIGYQTQRKVTGGIPAGAAVMSDGVSAEAGLAANDTQAAQTETNAFFLDVNYADTNAGQEEAVETGFSGYLDTSAAQSEARQSTLTRWATIAVTSGTTAPTNPNNALAENDGLFATCKAGGVSNGKSGLTLTIVSPLTGCGDAPTFLAYYLDTLTPGVDSASQRISYRQIGQGSDTFINTPVGNFSVTPFSVVLTNIDLAFDITVGFQHSSNTPALGGSITVDAVGISSQGVL